MNQTAAKENGRERAISVRHLNKVYRLYDKPSDRLRESLGFFGNKKRSRELYALHDVSFDVMKGETVGIIGTNGSGKSTILKIITGVLNPTSGEVLANGRISALLELGAGFNMEYTGIENIYLNGTMMGFSEKEIDERLDSILAFADIGDFVTQPVKTYSSGMFVRLAFAVAINIDPEILIVDEALSVGDVFFQAKCYRKFEEFRSEGKTILFVSHDLSSVAKFCDRVILLNKGVKVEEGDPKTVVNLYKKLLVGQGDFLPGEDGEDGSFSSDHPDEKKKETASPGVTGELPRNPDTIEYGEGGAHYTRVALYDENGILTNSIGKGTVFTIEVSVHFDRDLEEPICSYTFKNLKGTEITGTNTMFEKHDIGPKKAGDDITIRYTQRMDLQGGEYLLSFGCTGYKDGEFRVFQRLYDLLNVSVVSVKNTVGFYDMNSRIEILDGRKNGPDTGNEVGDDREHRQ